MFFHIATLTITLSFPRPRPFEPGFAMAAFRRKRAEDLFIFLFDAAILLAIAFKQLGCRFVARVSVKVEVKVPH